MLELDEEHVQLTERELSEIRGHLTEAEVLLCAGSRNSAHVTTNLSLGVVRGALAALGESAPDAARTIRKLRAALATLDVPPEVHERVTDAFRVLASRQQEALREVEASCAVDARFRQTSLRAELQGVRAELAGDDPAAALEPARRAQMILDELCERPAPMQQGWNMTTHGVNPAGGAKSPQQALADLVLMLGG